MWTDDVPEPVWIFSAEAQEFNALTREFESLCKSRSARSWSDWKSCMKGMWEINVSSKHDVRQPH